jgi:hypothetical protein
MDDADLIHNPPAGEVEPQAEPVAEAPKKAKKPVPAKPSTRTDVARARVLAQLAARDK